VQNVGEPNEAFGHSSRRLTPARSAPPSRRPSRRASWDIKEVEEMRNLTQQGSLFAEEWRESFKVIRKLPYKFSYKFEDADGRISQLCILDWEIGALFWSCLRRERDEKVALEKVGAKYLGQFLKTDLHLFLGTTQQYHQVAPNPWVDHRWLPRSAPEAARSFLISTPAPAMPWFVHIGHIPSNLGKIGSRGYHLVRREKFIVLTRQGPRRIDWRPASKAVTLPS
jgi:hypothetical protein